MPTPTPDALAGLVGRWELRQEGGECFGYYEPVLIEFFADGLYAARLEAPANIPLGGEFTLLDSNRLRFELLGGPAGGGLAVCNFQLRAGELWIASPDNVGALYVNPDVVYVATATAEAQARATDEAEMVAVATARTQAAAMIKVRATAIATERAAVRATAAADMPAAIANLADRFDMIFLPVPAGEFTMGSSEAEIDFALEQCNKFSDNQCERGRFDDETPQHQVYVDDFWIMQTEVSNAQWQRFMQAGGYDEPAYWTATGWVWRQSENVTQPSCWEDGDLNQAQQPVVCVSWYEAVAYSRWLASESGLEVRLPTEAEWEKAARGADGRIFPWGDEWDGSRLNYCDVNCENDWRDSDVDDGYRHTAPVGGYAAGASPYGALDMAGNVWEWTSTLYQEYPYNADDGREELEGDAVRRVVRGGSWDDDPVNLRPASRSWGGPFSRDGLLGVRLVVFAPN
jgi:formylglycine-generating enzyme required for sulfatase activity